MHRRSHAAAAFVSVIIVTAGLGSVPSANASPSPSTARASYVGSASPLVRGAAVTLAAPRGTTRNDLQLVTVGVANRRARVATPRGWSKVADKRFAHFRAVVFASHSTAPATLTKSRPATWRVTRTAYRGVSSIASTRLRAVRGAAHRPSLTSTGHNTMLLGASVQTGKAGRAAALNMVLRTAPARRKPQPVTVPVSVPPVITDPIPLPPIGDAFATIAELSGTPWRAGNATDPGYANHVIPGSPALSTTESSTLRGVGGQVILNFHEYSEPIYYRSASTTAKRKVNCTMYGCIGGTSAPITGNEILASGSDAQLNIVDLGARLSYEFWNVGRNANGTVKINSDGSVSAGSMSVVHLDGRGNKSVDGKNLNITGSGVSRLLGVIRAHEIRAAAIDPRNAIPHALSVSLPPSANCSSAFMEPATKTDGQSSSSNCVREGARIQLDPSYSCSSLSTKMGQAVCYAMQRYGAYDMDNGCKSICVYAQQDQSWSGGASDYSKVGVAWDYFGLGIPLTQMRVLRTWNGA